MGGGGGKKCEYMYIGFLYLSKKIRCGNSLWGICNEKSDYVYIGISCFYNKDWFGIEFYKKILLYI